MATARTSPTGSRSGRTTRRMTKTRQISRVHVVGLADAGLAGARDPQQGRLLLRQHPLASNDWIHQRPRPAPPRCGIHPDLKIFPSALNGEPSVRHKSLRTCPSPSGARAGRDRLRPTACPPAFRESYCADRRDLRCRDTNPLHLPTGPCARAGPLPPFRGCFAAEAIAAGEAVQVNRSVLHPRRAGAHDDRPDPPPGRTPSRCPSCPEQRTRSIAHFASNPASVPRLPPLGAPIVAP